MEIKGITPINSVILCKLNKEVIGELQESCVTSLESYIDEVPKIDLKIRKYITNQNDKKRIINPLYDEVKVKRYILLNDTEYYIIENIKNNKITNTKEVIAYKSEQRLTRFPINMEDFGVQILDDEPEQDVYSLDSLLREINWKLNHVDETIAYTEDNIPKLRWQENVSTDWLDFIRDLSEQFEFLPVFNEVDRTIDLYDINTLGEEIKICLSKDNYIKSKTKTDDGAELITLLKLKGSDELNIGYYILGGYDFITDFSYFIETKEMSDELISALAKYDEMIAIRTPIWQGLVDEKTAKETELTLNRNRWQMSISTIECYKNIINKYALSEDVVHETETRVLLSQEMDNELILRLKIEDLLEEIDLLQESIDNINLLCRYETCTDENGNLVFNENTLNELQEFIFIDIYSNDSFVDPDAMLEKGKSVLNERCRPTLEVEIDSINFMSRIIDNGFRLKWNGELNFGDIIILIDEDTDEEEYYYFLGYNMDYEDNSLTLKISNKKTLRENTKKINQWLKEIKKTKALLMNNKCIFNEVKKNELNMKGRDTQ